MTSPIFSLEQLDAVYKIKPAHSTISFLELFVAALSHRFPEVTSHMKIDNSSMDTLTLPALSSIPGQFPPVSPI